LWDITYAKYTGEFQFETKKQGAGGFRLAFELYYDFDIGLRQRRSADIDLNTDLRLFLTRGERPGCVWILERKVLDVLRQHSELRLHLLRNRLCRAAIRRRHKYSEALRACVRGGWLT